ncbi:MAG: transposase [Nitrospirota bacterium]
MPRIPRGQMPGLAYHVLNRGNGRATLFHKDTDYRVFCDLLYAAKHTFQVALLGFCVMPNHFHLVLQPQTPDALRALMPWWLTSHVRRYHRHDHSSGHVWQGRFKSFPIQQDIHVLTVLRYVLLNPVRAGLVTHAAYWPWSSLNAAYPPDPWPVTPPDDWGLRWLATPLPDDDLSQLRTCVNRQAPFGAPDWIARVARTLGLQPTIRPRGRPPKPHLEK